MYINLNIYMYICIFKRYFFAICKRRRAYMHSARVDMCTEQSKAGRGDAKEFASKEKSGLERMPEPFGVYWFTFRFVKYHWPVEIYLNERDTVQYSSLVESAGKP